jgi:hypothetical protein
VLGIEFWVLVVEPPRRTLKMQQSFNQNPEPNTQHLS